MDELELTDYEWARQVLDELRCKEGFTQAQATQLYIQKRGGDGGVLPHIQRGYRSGVKKDIIGGALRQRDPDGLRFWMFDPNTGHVPLWWHRDDISDEAALRFAQDLRAQGGRLIDEAVVVEQWVESRQHRREEDVDGNRHHGH